MIDGHSQVVSSPPAAFHSADSLPTLTLQTQRLLQENIRSVQESYDKWKPLAIALGPKYEEIATVLCEHATDLNIAAVTGSTVGAAAGVTALATMGMLLAPATFGISAAVGAALAATTASVVGVGAAAAVVSHVALAADVILEKKNIDSIADIEKEVTDAEKLMCNALKELVDFCKIIQELQMRPGASADGGAFYSFIQAVTNGRAVNEVDVSLATVIVAARAVMTTGGLVAVQVAGSLAGGVGVILDVRQVLKSWGVLWKRKEERSKVAQQLCEQAKHLKQMDDQVQNTIVKATELMTVVSKSLERGCHAASQFGAHENSPVTSGPA